MWRKPASRGCAQGARSPTEARRQLDRRCLLLPNRGTMSSALPPIPAEEAANRLFVEAVLLWNRVDGEPVEQQARTLRRVQANLWTIIERHSSATLAVRLVIGETVGPLSVRRVEAAVVDAQARAAAEPSPAAQAQTRAAHAAGVDVIFRDCPDCPEMVVIPAGRAFLASGRDVVIAASFAVGKFAVTFEEWDACVSLGGCSHRPEDRGWGIWGGWGRGRRPVIDVSWDDAQDYVAWLSKRTGNAYRLLSEAEWEYAAQAGTGREAKVTPGAGEANCKGCGSRWDGEQTAPVGSFPANAFGLHDMLGNVKEWTADCLSESNIGARSDGSAHTDGDCSRRVLRGGCWRSRPELTRSARHFVCATDVRDDTIGFRVARTL
jgi:formylglycine-generating enzyme required for sulfatase activity